MAPADGGLPPLGPVGPERPPVEVAGPLLRAHHWMVATACLRASGDEGEAPVAWQAMALTAGGSPAGERWCDDLAARHPANAGVHAARAIALLRRGEADEAERALARARECGETRFVRLAEAVRAEATGTDERGERRRAYLESDGDPYLLAILTAGVTLAMDSVRARAATLEAVRLAPDDQQANALAVHAAVGTPGPELAPELIDSWALRVVALAPNTGLAAMAVAAALRDRRDGDAEPPAELTAWAETYHRLREAAAAEPGRSTALSAAPGAVTVPAGSVLEQPGRCACDHLRDLRGEIAEDYVRDHLVVVGHLEGLASVEAECPDTGAHWIGLEGSEPEAFGETRLVQVPELATTADETLDDLPEEVPAEAAVAMVRAG